MLPRLSLLLVTAALAVPAPALARVQNGGGGASAGQGPAQSEPSGKASRVIDAAESAIGTPWVSGGNSKDGFDCSGLTTWAFKKAGVKLPRTSFDQYEVGRAVPRSEIAEGDLVFWDAAGPGASHVGIAVSGTRAISATSSGGVMEHAIRGGYWGDHFLGARRR